MKVAYLLGSLNRGGAETLVLDVFRHWRNAPFPFIGIHRKDGAYKEEFYAAGPKMYQLAPKRLGYIRYLVQLRKLLKSEQITLIHTQHWLDSWYAYIATIGTRMKIVQTCHGFYPSNWLNRELCRMSIRMVGKVCFVSEYEKKWYQERQHIANGKCHVVYNGIDFAKFDRIEPSEDVIFSNAGRVRLCMVGNFVSVRSQIVIVKAIRSLRQHGITNFDFYFIGNRVEAEAQCYDSCVEYSDINQLDNIHFVGGRNDVPAILKTMDGFVYSSACDTFGIAVIEAIVSELPVVVNDWPVMKEVCGEENEGIRYYRSDDAEDAANAIAALLTNMETSKEAAKKNAVSVRKKYSIEQHILCLESIYKNI